MCVKTIDTIDFIAELLLEVADDLRTESFQNEITPLLDLLQTKAYDLTEIYNEFCWLAENS